MHSRFVRGSMLALALTLAPALTYGQHATVKAPSKATQQLLKDTLQAILDRAVSPRILESDMRRADGSFEIGVTDGREGLDDLASSGIDGLVDHRITFLVLNHRVGLKRRMRWLALLARAPSLSGGGGYRSRLNLFKVKTTGRRVQGVCVSATLFD